MLKSDPTVKSKHETLKRQAQDKEEWRGEDAGVRKLSLDRTLDNDHD